MDKVNVGLIGAGRIGKLHAQHLAYRIPGVRLLAVADVFADAAQRCAAECQIPAAFHDHRRILDDPDVEAVVICSSTDTHAQFIEEAAAAGKHIFCEKPIDFDLGKIDRALQAVARAGVKLQVGFNRRFDPNFKRVRDVVAAGKIGTPHVVRITSRDPAPPPIVYVKVSGGIFLDMTIHDFDMARYLIGDEVMEVYATG
ncbi:MAG: inositol 2-dehydrogenase, partial [Chloroflexi bacterium]|nr:inositol 2-dehydrogenase [Chloroflexota bacterium]